MRSRAKPARSRCWGPSQRCCRTSRRCPCWFAIARRMNGHLVGSLRTPCRVLLPFGTRGGTAPSHRGGKEQPRRGAGLLLAVVFLLLGLGDLDVDGGRITEPTRVLCQIGEAIGAFGFLRRRVG